MRLPIAIKEMSDHYVTVVSNTKDDRNSPSHFYNVLNKPLSLAGEWLVGIRKMIYHNRFCNILDNRITLFHLDKPPIPYLYHIVQDDVTSRRTSSGRYASVFISDKYDYKIEFLQERREIVFTLNSNVYHKLQKICGGKFSFHIGRHDETTPFVHHTYTVSSDKSKVVVMKIENDLSNIVNVEVHDIEYITETIVPRGIYHIMQLLSLLTRENVQFKLTVNNHVQISITLGDIQKLVLSDDLCNKLGFVGTVVEPPTLTAEHPPQLELGIYAFYIYSNIVAESHVGDTEVKLLDVIGLKDSTIRTVTVDINSPIYRRVSMNMIDEIEIKIASDTGQLIPFYNSSGNAKTMILLHFVKI